MAHTCISKVFVLTHFDRMLHMQQLQHSPGARRLLQDAIIHPSTPSIWSTGDDSVAAIPSSHGPPPSMSSSDNDTSPSNFDTVNHFSPSVAIIMVALLSAFFFMGFFSLYMRRCATSSSSNPRASLRRAIEFQEQQEEGIDPEFLHSLPLIVYSSAKKKGSNIECVVCLTDFEEHEPLRQLPVCKHVFHQDCIDMWLFSHSTCPLCRRGITGSMSVLRSAVGGFRQVSLIGGGGSGQHELTERESSNTIIGIHRGVSVEMGSTVNSGYRQYSEAMTAISSIAAGEENFPESNRESHNMDSRRRLPVRCFTRSNSTGQMGPADEANSSGESPFPRTSLQRSNSEMVVQHSSHAL